ncbi:hypothetical protein PGT21_036299 [Puccinia graminis f. sp. tritici]|uniref:Uncharacterized protein n=1 Tax=Puccinia graminis f. sp. tritici TaxID=56615 RepID=A0A5B0PBX9_PUCGR|nr:hypothetical protein PGT21_036299 [Puccinia graminis f. sp. tritici]KAA1100375.1 hypothetical protein PGTUg99_024275 [Puccinia graminis f. sp. tritici]
MSLPIPDDLSRLEIVFREPESIGALETFNDILHRPSATMLGTLVGLFNRALQHPPSSGLDCYQLESNPLFILLLLKRVLLHSDPIAPLQPSKINLRSTFQESFLPTFINFRANAHPDQPISNLSNHLIICLTRLSTRLLSSFHSNLDPIASLIQSSLHFIGNLDPSAPHLEPILDHLVAIKEILLSLHQSKSIDSIYLIRQITHKHYENLFATYSQLETITRHLSSQLLGADNSEERYRSYQTATRSISVLLKIFKLMVEPMEEHRGVLSEVIAKFVADFQVALDLEIRLMDSVAPPAQKFSSHVMGYGALFLQIQTNQPSLIPDEVLTTYLKILEFVSSRHQLMIAESSSSAVVGDPGIQQDLAASSGALIRFYRLLIQSLKLLNGSLNPWSSYSNDPDPASGLSKNLLESLSSEEVSRLVSIVEPLLTLKFDSTGSFEDDRFLYCDDEEDEEKEEEEDESDEETGEIMEIEEMDQGDIHEEAPVEEDKLDGPDGSCDQLQFQQHHHPWNEPLDSPTILANKGQTLNCFQPTYPIWNSPAKDDWAASTEITRLEPLQIEAQALLSTLKSL